eukprot:comp21936_c0_seq1/m.31581 comp21936_c0_seq1/g.31581  ORF comp21936_c0_seq1/g.31581 comp21936_c0_seq1/m.31581 type:complete len:361 (-) comp21936_c0_seq1:766-1848(-)
MANVTDQAYVTLAATEEYALGAYVLAQSLCEAKTTRQLVCMCTDKISADVRSHLSTVFDEVISVDELNSNDSVNLALLCRPELGITFTKLFCWKLTKYTKCVFMDADTLVLQNVDDMFERDELSAAPDVGWPDCFNSGVFVYVPSLDTFQKLCKFAETEGSFDGGDQGLLNAYFHDWATADIKKHLPFVYNLNANATYFYAPAYKKYGHLTRVVHFIGAGKPWHWARDNKGDIVGADQVPHALEHIRTWFSVLDRHMPKYTPSMFSVKAVGTGGFGTTWTGGSAVHTTAQPAQQESGFAAIQARLDELMGSRSYGDEEENRQWEAEASKEMQKRAQRIASVGPAAGAELAKALGDEDDEE